MIVTVVVGMVQNAKGMIPCFCTARCTLVSVTQSGEAYVLLFGSV